MRQCLAAGINTEDDTMLYHYKAPNPSIDPNGSLKVARDAGDPLLLSIMQQSGVQSHSITLVEDHQETLKDDPTLVSWPALVIMLLSLAMDMRAADASFAACLVM